MRRVKAFFERLTVPAAWCPPEAAAAVGAVCGIGMANAPRTAFFLPLVLFLPRFRRYVFLVFAAAALVSAAVCPRAADPELRMPCFVQGELRVTDLGLSRLPGMPLPTFTEAEIAQLADASGAKLPFSGRVLVRFPAEFTGRPVAGSMLTGEGVLEMPHGDFARYVRSRGACGVLSFDDCRISGERRSWRSVLADLREILLEQTVRHIEPEARRNAAASLFFGIKGGIGRASRRDLVNAGVIHLYSVSGLHVGICAGMLFLLLRGVPSFRLRYGLLILLTLLYVLSTGANVPAVRAWIMISAWAGARAFLRWIPARTVLGFCAAGMLICEPAWIGDMGFLYSFGITLVLVLLSGNWREMRAVLSLPLGLMPHAPLRRRTARRIRAGHGFLNAVGACVTAFLGGAAVGLFFQKRLLPGSAAANLLLLPVTLALFPLLALKMATGWIAEDWDRLLAGMVSWVWDVMDAVVACAQCWTPTVTGRPAGWTAALFLLGLGILLWPEAGRRVRIAGAATVGAVLIFWHAAMFCHAPAVLVVHGGRAELPAVAVADPAAGTGLVVNVPDAASAAKIADFLLEHGISEVDRVMFSAPRSGAARGLRALLSRMRVRQMVKSGSDRHDRAFRLRLGEALREIPGMTETDRSGGLSVETAEGRLARVRYGNPATGVAVCVEFVERPDRLRIGGHEIPFPHVSESSAAVFDLRSGRFATQTGEARLTFSGTALY